MTKREAKLRGYTHAANFEDVIKIDDWDEKTPGYVLLHTVGESFTILEEDLEELVVNYLTEQDIVADSEALLCEEARRVDYSCVAKELNKAFEKHKWFPPTRKELKKAFLVDREQFLLCHGENRVEMEFSNNEGVMFSSRVYTGREDKTLGIFVKYEDFSGVKFVGDPYRVRDLNFSYGVCNQIDKGEIIECIIE